MTAAVSGGVIPAVVPVRVDGAPTLYEPTFQERLESSIVHRATDPGERLQSIAALGAGTIGGALGGRWLGSKLGGHGLLGGILGGVLGGAAALGATLLPNLLRDARSADGVLPRPRLDASEVRALVGHETDRARDAWTLGDGPEAMRNAHMSNTAEQLRIALEGDYNSLEGDVRLEHGVPVMSHDRAGAHALLFADWLRVGLATGKHLRIDFKEAAALDQVSALLKRMHVPDEQVTLNVSTGTPHMDSDVDLATLERVRAAHPKALIGFNLTPTLLGREPRAAVEAAARAIGGPTQVAIAVQDANPARIRELRDAGLFVGVWNDVSTHPVEDVAGTVAQLRERGANGLVDLRTAEDPLQL
jgi:hypothetical protein